MKSLITLLVITTSALALISQKISSHPEEYQNLGPAPSDNLKPLYIFITQQNTEKLTEILYAVSDPRSKKYGQHLTNDQITELIQPSTLALQSVKQWLINHGIQKFELNGNNDIIKAEVSIEKAEELLSTKFHLYNHIKQNITITRCLQYSLPAEIDQHIDWIGPTIDFPSFFAPRQSQNLETNQWVPNPENLRQIYSVGDYKASSPDNSVGVDAYADSYSLDDLQQFFKEYAPDSVGRKPTLYGKNNPSKPSEESNLDIQFAMAMGNGVAKAYYWENGNDCTFYHMIQEVSTATEFPYVISNSYGQGEEDTAISQMMRLDIEIQKLGARGISVISASGDNGVGCQNGGEVNDSHCKAFQPNYPPSSPYVTAVGGTQNQHEVAWQYSAGGFSTFYAPQEFQKPFIKQYLEAAQNIPKDSCWNQTGAGYPDIAGQAQNVPIIFKGRVDPSDGTSCSSPIAAGIVALLNDKRLSEGKPTLGWLNPLIYQHPEIFNDITQGHNPGCGTQGFYCAKGWDPVTGLGTLNFEKFSKLLDDLNEEKFIEY